jgi:pimeloyl-ACP methyl ester carboxylesterase
MRPVEAHRTGIISNANTTLIVKKHPSLSIPKRSSNTFHNFNFDRQHKAKNTIMWSRIFAKSTRDDVETPQQEDTPNHLVVLVNGLFGSRHNWKYISEVLGEHLDTTNTLIHVSKANEFTATYAGIDTCGSALATEVKKVVAANPSLEKISFIGHSMGGLIARYAAGELYDTQDTNRDNKQTIAGCKPQHFISMATPHLGCDPAISSPAAVPLVSWLKLPLFGRISPTVSSTLYRRTGRQFFLEDADNDNRPPLLYLLSQDIPAEKKYFWSALAAFQTRTAYANSSGDYFVGWANSSVRDVHELPKFPAKTRGRGVVRQDPLELAWEISQRPAVENFRDSSVGLDPGHGQPVNDGMDASSPQDFISKEEKLPIVSSREIDNKKTRSEYINESLKNLQKLQWRRIDCCFAGGTLPLLAHQHMQVQRRWINSEGKATAKHLALQFVAMEQIVNRGSKQSDLTATKTS